MSPSILTFFLVLLVQFLILIFLQSAACGPGTYWEESIDVCVNCGEGTFNPDPYQLQCQLCPPDKPLSDDNYRACKGNLVNIRCVRPYHSLGFLISSSEVYWTNRT